MKFAPTEKMWLGQDKMLQTISKDSKLSDKVLVLKFHISAGSPRKCAL